MTVKIASTAPAAPKKCPVADLVELMAGTYIGSAASTAIRIELRARQAEGELASSVDVADLARYLTIVGQGAAVQAAGGATREELRRVVSVAMRAWPEVS